MPSEKQLVSDCMQLIEEARLRNAELREKFDQCVKEVKQLKMFIIEQNRDPVLLVLCTISKCSNEQRKEILVRLRELLKDQ